MAKKTDKTKYVLEREYNVPLRKEWLKVPRYKRSKKAVKALKEFLIKHMKPSEDEKGRIQLKIGKYLNENIWKDGIKNPPHHVKIITKKDDKGIVYAEIEGKDINTDKEDKKEKSSDDKKTEDKKAKKDSQEMPKKEIKQEDKSDNKDNEKEKDSQEKKADKKEENKDKEKTK